MGEGGIEFSPKLVVSIDVLTYITKEKLNISPMDPNSYSIRSSELFHTANTCIKPMVIDLYGLAHALNQSYLLMWIEGQNLALSAIYKKKI